MRSALATLFRLTAAAAAGLALTAPAAASTLPGRNGPIAAVGSHRGKALIAVVWARGKVRTAYETGLRDVIFTHPTISPDGRRVFFSGIAGTPHPSLAQVDLRTGKPTGVGTGKLDAYDPSFLDDGRIVFNGSPRGNAHSATYIAGTNGGHRRRLLRRGTMAVSADGRWFIAFEAATDYHRLLLLDERGRAVRTLTDDARYRYLRAEFSPDGKWIAYEREIERPGQRRHRADVFVVRRDGTHRRRLTFGGNSADPVFSPDGRWLAFTRFDNGLGGNLLVLPLAHPQRQRVLAHIEGTRFQEPAWTPAR